jgi:DNA-binding NarL/FixJ family response regulator
MISPCKILIFDNFPLFSSGIAQFLAKEPVLKVIGEVNRTEEINKHISMLNPDIIVVDVMHCKNAGIKAIKKFKCIFKHVPVLVITSSDFAECIPEQLRLGVKGIVFSESKTHDLIHAIKKICAGGNYFPESIKGIVNRTNVNSENENVEANYNNALTDRETDILNFLCQGLTYKEIGDKLFISPRTVEVHKRNISAKLNLKSKAELVRYSLRNNFQD